MFTARKLDNKQENYNPYVRPMIVDTMDKAKVEHMIKNHIIDVESVEYINIPAMRFIGMDTLTHGLGDQYGEMWGKSMEIFPVLEAMPEYHTFISDTCAFMHRYDKADEPMHYIVGRFMKADTPVPEGFDYFDIRESNACLMYIRGEHEDMLNNYFGLLMDQNRKENYTATFPEGAYIAEIYTKESIARPGVVSKMGILGFGVVKNDK